MSSSNIFGSSHAPQRTKYRPEPLAVLVSGPCYKSVVNGNRPLANPHYVDENRPTRHALYTQTVGSSEFQAPIGMPYNLYQNFYIHNAINQGVQWF